MRHKKNLHKYEDFFSFVGMTRFELATPRPPDVCATGLRYIPKFLQTCAPPLAGLHPETFTNLYEYLIGAK